MKVSTFFVLILVCGIQLSVGQDDSITIAIAKFRNNTNIISNFVLEQSIPEILKTELAQNENIIVVERSRIDALLAEQALGQSGLIDASLAQQVGHLLGAQYVLTGEIAHSDSDFRIDVHITKVTTGEVFGEKVIGPDYRVINEMTGVLSKNIVNNVTGKGDRLSVSRIKNYHVPWVIGGAIGTGLTAVLLHSAFKSNYDKYHDSLSLNDFDTYYNRANRYHKARNITAGVAVAAMLSSIYLWLRSNSSLNQILAYGVVQHESRLVLNPYINGFSNSCGFQIRMVL